jgi:hypothetical protein
MTSFDGRGVRINVSAPVASETGLPGWNPKLKRRLGLDAPLDEEPAGSDEILRLYEARRAARRAEGLPADAGGLRETRLEAAEAAEVEGSPASTSASAAPATTEQWQPVEEPAGEVLPPVPAPPDHARPGPAPDAFGAQPADPFAGSSLQVSPSAGLPAMRPAVQGNTSLTASSPALNLSDRLLDDRFIASRGSRRGVVAGSALVFAGLATIVADQALLSRGVVVTPADTDLTSLGLVAAALGVVLAVLFLFVPRRRSLRVRLAATQREEWARVQAEAASLRRKSIVGAAVAVTGLAATAVAYSALDQPVAGYVALLLLLAAAAGLGTMLWAVARRGVAQRLYVQTLVLQRLEQTGLGPSAESDPRIAPVLRSLDKLLGALPESAVRRFLASDEASAYLDLIDELGKDGGHGR